MNDYSHPGHTLTLIAPTGGVVSGVPLLIGTFFVVPLVTAAAGVAFAAKVEGVIAVPKTSAQAWLQGDPIYFNIATQLCDNSGASVGPLVGGAEVNAQQPAGNPSTAGWVKLKGTPALRQGAGVAAQKYPAPLSKAGAATLTAAEVVAQGNRGTIVMAPGGAVALTLPTAALLVTQLNSVTGAAAVGDMLEFDLINGDAGANSITITAGAGGTFDANQAAGSRVVPQNTAKTVRIRMTNVTPSSEAYVVYA